MRHKRNNKTHVSGNLSNINISNNSISKTKSINDSTLSPESSYKPPHRAWRVRHKLLLCFLATFPLTVRGFNLDTETPVTLTPPEVFTPPVKFGYSLAFHREHPGRPVLLVGAPLSPSSQLGVNIPGALYSCHLTPQSSCRRLDVDVAEKDDEYSDDMSFDDHKDNQRLGAMVAVRGSAVLVCAPNWYYVNTNMYGKQTSTPVGRCFYSSDGNLNQFTNFSAPYDMNQEKDILYYTSDGYCQAGFSAALSDEKDRVVLGSPGCLAWTGDVLVGRPTDVSYSRKGNDYSGDDFNVGVWNSNTIPYNRYLGYSVAVGRFNNGRGYVAGSPRTSALEHYSSANNTLLSTVSIMVEDGSQVLSIWSQLFPPNSKDWHFAYCGHSLAVGDVNGDGLEDVVVGCPYYRGDRGAVLVYYQTKRLGQYKVELEVTSVYRTGATEGAKFGSAVAFLGDIDGDNIGDVAVSAPSLDGGRGAVYVYCGSADGLPTEPCQTLRGDLTQKGGFGAAVAGSPPYVAVAATGAEQVVLYRTLPVLTLTPSVGAVSELDLDNTCRLPSSDAASTAQYPCVDVRVCVTYTVQDERRTRDFSVTTSLDVLTKLPRLVFGNRNNTQKKKVSATNGKEECYTSKVYDMKESEEIVSYSIVSTAAFLQSPDDKVVLDPRLDLTATTVLRMAVHCPGGEVERCRSNVLVSVTQKGTYTYGVSSDVRILVTVTNLEDPAYYPKITVGSGEDLMRSGSATVEDGPPATCNSAPDTTTFTCGLGGVLNKGASIIISLSLVPSQTFIGNLETENNFFTIAAAFTTSSVLVNEEEARVTKKIDIALNPVLELTKTSSPEDLNLASWSPPKHGSPLARLGPMMNHTYELNNKNTYPMYGVTVTVLWPLKHAEAGYLLYIAKPPVVRRGDGKVTECVPLHGRSFDDLGLWGESANGSGKGKDNSRSSPEPGDSQVVLLSISCPVGDLSGEEGVSVHITSYAVQDTFLENKKKKTAQLNNVTSSATVTVSHAPFQLPFDKTVAAKITNTVIYPTRMLWWPVWLGVGVGLAILAAVVAIFCSCRKKKQAQADGIDGEAEEGEEQPFEEGEEALEEGADGEGAAQQEQEENVHEMSPMNVSSV